MKAVIRIVGAVLICISLPVVSAVLAYGGSSGGHGRGGSSGHHDSGSHGGGSHEGHHGGCGWYGGWGGYPWVSFGFGWPYYYYPAAYYYDYGPTYYYVQPQMVYSSPTVNYEPQRPVQSPPESGSRPTTLASSAQNPPALPNKPKQSVTAEDIKALVKGGMSEEVVLSQIRNNRAVFHLTTAEIIDLKASGVGEKVIDFMINTPNQR